MPKKCIICEENAIYAIKGSSEFYCEECAKEHFSDIELLQKIEGHAKLLKNLISEKNI